MADDERTPRQIGALFAAQVMGGALSDAPTEGSRHERLLEAERRYRAGELSEAQWDAIAEALMAEARLEARAMNET